MRLCSQGVSFLYRSAEEPVSSGHSSIGLPWMTSPLLLPPSLHPSREAEFPKIKHVWSYREVKQSHRCPLQRTRVKDAFASPPRPPPQLLGLDSEEEEVCHQSERVFLLLFSYMAASPCLSPSGIGEQEEEASPANA